MSSEFIWTPPGLDEQSVREFLSLKEGIPESANASIYRWITGNKYESEMMHVPFLINFQNALREDLGLRSETFHRVSAVKEFLHQLDQQTLAYLVDFILSDINTNLPSAKANSMQDILRSAGAGWAVGPRNGRFGLVKVLPSGVVETAEYVVSQNDQAGGLLQSAWDAAFGINKRPSHAYYDAVRAVEVLSTALISPNDRHATLGKDINVLRNTPAKWSFVLNGSKKEPSSVERVLSLMQLLWHSHSDRHGREDYEDVTVEQSQAAVLLASTLVGWLSQGMLKRE